MNENDLIRRGDVFDDLDWLKKNVCPSNADGVMEMKKRIAQVEAVVSQSSTEFAKDAVRNYKIGHGIRITQKPGDNPGCDEMWINRNIAACCIEIEEEAIVNACIRAAIEEKLDNLYLIDKKFVLNALTRMRWVSVKERLPEERINPLTQDFEEVICACDFGGIPKRRDTRVCKFGNGHFYHGFQLMDGVVTHWMQKPELPEEKENPNEKHD